MIKQETQSRENEWHWEQYIRFIINSVVLTKTPVVVETSKPKDLRRTIDAMIQILELS